MNNNKTKANDLASKQSPRSKSTIVDKVEEVNCVMRDTGSIQPEIGEQVKTQDKNTGIVSIIPGMRKLALQEIEHPDGKVCFIINLKRKCFHVCDVVEWIS